MKHVLLLMLLAATGASGQPFTNIIITVTNKGIVYERARVTSVAPDHVIVTSGLKIGRIPFTDLPEPVRQELGYNPKLDKAWREIKESQARSEAELQRLRVEMYVEERRRKVIEERVDSQAVFLSGRVIQRLDDGFLVSSGEVGTPKVTSTFSGTCFLEKDAANAQWIDEDKVTLWAYPISTYTYTSVLKASKTVRVMTPDRQRAIALETERVGRR
jgi:hypothetical protein